MTTLDIHWADKLSHSSNLVSYSVCEMASFLPRALLGGAFVGWYKCMRVYGFEASLSPISYHLHRYPSLDCWTTQKSRMAPVATEPRSEEQDKSVDEIKNLKAKTQAEEKPFNPFYSPYNADDGDDTYEYNRYKVRWSFISLDFISNVDIFVIYFLACLSQIGLGTTRRVRSCGPWYIRRPGEEGSPFRCVKSETPYTGYWNWDWGYRSEAIDWCSEGRTVCFSVLICLDNEINENCSYLVRCWSLSVVSSVCILFSLAFSGIDLIELS